MLGFFSSTLSSQRDNCPADVLFSRVFLSVYKVVKEVEECSDHLLVLDQAIHSTLPPVALPLQLDRISTAVYELVSFSITRALKFQRIPEVPLSSIFPSFSVSQECVCRPLSSIYLPPHTLQHMDPCPFLKAKFFSYRQQQQYHFLLPSQGIRCSDASLFESKWSKDGDQEDEGRELEGSNGAVFSDPIDFVSMRYMENPASVMKSCSLCAAQVLVQSIWINLFLFQRLHVVGVAQLALAPLRMPSKILRLTPRMALVQLFHTAQRFFELALHSALNLSDANSSLRDRLSYPLPLLVSLITHSKRLLLDTETEECIQKLRIALELDTSRECEGDGFLHAKGIDTVSPLTLSPFTHWAETSEEYHLKKNRTLAAIVFCLTHFSLGAFSKISYLWPVLHLHREEMTGISSLPLALCSSVEKNTTFNDLEKENGGLFSKVKAFYLLEDILLVIRAAIQEICLIGFMEGYQGAKTAQQKLLRLSQTLSKLEHACFPHFNKKCSTQYLHSSTEAEKPIFGPTFADEVYTLFWNSFCHDLAILQSWPWPFLNKNPSSPFSSLHGCDSDQVADYFELKQIILLLTVFFDLVEHRDNEEEADALIEHLSDPQSNPAGLSLKSKRKLINTIHTYTARRFEDRQRRIIRIRGLLTMRVQPILLELSNSSNGGAASRARELLGLYWLLTAEVLRSYRFPSPNDLDASLSNDESNEGVAPLASSHEARINGGKVEKLEVGEEVVKANAEAAKNCEAVREFLGVTMQTSRTSRGTYFPESSRSLECSVQKEVTSAHSSSDIGFLGSDVASPSSSSTAKSNWRLLLSPQNRGAREFLFSFSSSSISHHSTPQAEPKEALSESLQWEGVHAFALLPPLWIRMWLILCRSIFRTASVDMIVAKDRYCMESSGSTEQEGLQTEEEEKEKSSSVTSSKRRTRVSRLPKMSPTKQNPRKKMVGVPWKGKHETKLEGQLAKNSLLAQWRLRFSAEELCFWYRWHWCFIQESESLHSTLETAEKRSRNHTSDFPAPSSNWCRAISSLHKIMFSLLNHSIASLPFEGSAGLAPLPSNEVIAGALQKYFPVFISAESAFLHYFTRDFSTGISRGAFAFGSNNSDDSSSDHIRETLIRTLSSNNRQTRPLFSSPSVASCIPCIVALVNKYWEKLGTPSVSHM